VTFLTPQCQAITITGYERQRLLSKTDINKMGMKYGLVKGMNCRYFLFYHFLISANETLLWVYKL
jgi:hypothetical protein